MAPHCSAWCRKLSRHSPAPRALGTLLAGIITFFVLEKLVLWRHSHDDHECDVHRSTVTLVILGDAVHTFVDGVVIAAATLVSIPLGMTTALAVAAHEIPAGGRETSQSCSPPAIRGRARYC